MTYPAPLSLFVAPGITEIGMLQVPLDILAALPPGTVIFGQPT